MSSRPACKLQATISSFSVRFSEVELDRALLWRFRVLQILVAVSLMLNVALFLNVRHPFIAQKLRIVAGRPLEIAIIGGGHRLLMFAWGSQVSVPLH